MYIKGVFKSVFGKIIKCEFKVVESSVMEREGKGEMIGCVGMEGK